MYSVLCSKTLINVSGATQVADIMKLLEKVAERQGFEPWVRKRTTVFETAPFDHSGISPLIGSRRHMTSKPRVD